MTCVPVPPERDQGPTTSLGNASSAAIVRRRLANNTRTSGPLT
jgi:hypothetical protein